MTASVPGAGALPVRRSYLVDTTRLTGVVVEIDPTREPAALAVLQAGLHEPPEGTRLVFGYAVAVTGLGAWVGDRRVRVSIWPALVDGVGAIHDPDRADDNAGTEGDLLVIDFDPVADRAALDDLARVGRLIVAGPDAGPIPLVVDLDRALLADVLAAVHDPGH